LCSGFKPGTDARLGFTHTLGDRSHLSTGVGDERNDAIRFAQRIGSQNDPVAPVQAHAMKLRRQVLRSAIVDQAIGVDCVIRINGVNRSSESARTRLILGDCINEMLTPEVWP
jgi:hypothetical protein